MTRTVQNFIDGKSVDAADGRRADLIDPTTGEVFGSAPVSGADGRRRGLRARPPRRSRPGATRPRPSGSARC